jgi:hypothetical protein
VQRRYLDQWQRGVDDALQWSQNVLKFRVLHFITAESRDHEMVVRYRILCRRGDLLGNVGGLLLLFSSPALVLFPPSGRRLDCGDAVRRHVLAEDGRVFCGREIVRQRVSTGWQCGPAERESLEIAPELFRSMTGSRLERLYERLADPAIFLEKDSIARQRQTQQPDGVGNTTQVRFILDSGAIGSSSMGAPRIDMITIGG